MAIFQQVGTQVGSFLRRRVGGGFFRAAPSPVNAGPHVLPTSHLAHPVFGGVTRLFVGNHQNPRVPLAPARHPLQRGQGFK